MFTLCMSRGHPPLPDAQYQNSVTTKQVKGGYLLRYKRGLFCKNWSEEWFVLYEDSTLAWFADKGLSRPRGRVRISEFPELLAVGEWTRQVPKRPRFPRSCHIGQLLAIGTRIPHDVHWLMAQSSAEVNDWMTAISNTLPPPPHLPLENKRLSLTSERDRDVFSNKPAMKSSTCCSRNGNAAINHSPTSVTSNKTRNHNYDADHTVLSGVVIDWGHGWGWGQNAWAAHTACVTDAAVSSALYCHALGDYAVSGFDEVDCSAFGDFIF
ncbi:unnamed protein product [Tenebrio molitor]|nr:unnamed protein product [Tenebrio molitor]